MIRDAGHILISNEHLKEEMTCFHSVTCCNVLRTVLRLFSLSLGAMAESVLEFEQNMIKREFMYIGLKFELNTLKADGYTMEWNLYSPLLAEGEGRLWEMERPKFLVTHCSGKWVLDFRLIVSRLLTVLWFCFWEIKSETKALVLINQVLGRDSFGLLYSRAKIHIMCCNWWRGI